MELTAICEALETLGEVVEIRTDSTYVEKCFNQNWHERWLRDGHGRDRTAKSRTETCGNGCLAWCGTEVGK
jgi:ribonuclease HI